MRFKVCSIEELTQYIVDKVYIGQTISFIEDMPESILPIGKKYVRFQLLKTESSPKFEVGEYYNIEINPGN